LLLKVGFISRLTDASLRAPARFLIVAGALTVVSVWLASGLEIRSSFEELLPSDVPSVAHVKELVRRVGGDGTVLVVIEVLDPAGGLQHAEDLARELAQEYLDFGPSTIRAVEWNMDRIKKWYADFWPLFLSLVDLEKARDTIRTERAKAKARANPLLLHLDEDEKAPAPSLSPEAVPWLDPKQPLPREKVEQRFARYRDGYLVHPDGRSLTILVRPTGTALGVHEARHLLDQMRQVADGHQDELQRYHLRVGFGGTFPLFVAEYESILNDVKNTALITIALVLGSLFLFYRDLRSTFALFTAIIGAVALTFGLTRLVIGYLNTQTAFLGAIVVGNGINYGLIYLARVNQLRRAGTALEPACMDGARTSARATLVASAASSVSFGVLVVAANRGFRHFGFIGGIGMLMCWLFTFALVPALLTAFERVRPVRATAVPTPSRTEVPGFLRRLFAAPKTIALVFASLTAISAAAFLRQLPTALERNLNNLTNDLGREKQLVEDNDRAQSSLGKSVAGAIALLPSRAAADEFCDVIRQRAAQVRWANLLEGCDTISSVVPRFQSEKLALIGEIERMISDLVLESLPADQAARLREVKGQLASQRILTLAEAPPNMVDRFRERDGTVGRIATITAKPDAKLEFGPNLNNFAAAVRNVPVQGRLFDAAGENVVFADLLENIAREGPLTTFLSLVGVCLLVVALFRSARASVLVIVTLITGVILMGGVAVALRLKINFFNFIVFPITFGIAVDYGANVVARVRERKGNVLASLVEVGPAVALCSWTSIIGYSSLLHAANRALKSFGWYAVIGEVTSILSALILLPALRLIVPARVIVPAPDHSQDYPPSQL
jgi:predicted RND superfamily exporter protein